jgi:hypothetical protein
VIVFEGEPDHIAAERSLRLLELAKDDTGHATPLESTHEQPELPNAHLPEQFWTARPELAHIRAAAHARAVSADAMLGVVLARAAVNVPPWFTLPNPIGSGGTLDLAVGLIGPSGVGKSQAFRGGEELLPFRDDRLLVLSIGSSGEGPIEAYLDFVTEDDGDKKVRVKRQVRDSILFHLDEGQALIDGGRGRTGSTILSTIRSMATGERLGQANATEERKRQLASGTYRAAFVIGFQLEPAMGLLDDAPGGTPQRFLLLNAVDPTIPAEPPAAPGALPWDPAMLGQRAAGPLDLTSEIAAEIRGRHLAKVRGDAHPDPLDSHRDLLRLKVAALLSILAGRWNIGPDDWALAGAVMTTSAAVRHQIQAAAAHRAAMAEKADVAKHVRRTDAVDQSGERRAVEVMTKAIARHVHKATCDGPCVKRCVSQATPGKYRSQFSVDAALDEAANRGWIRLAGDNIHPGTVRPA